MCHKASKGALTNTQWPRNGLYQCPLCVVSAGLHCKWQLVEVSFIVSLQDRNLPYIDPTGYEDKFRDPVLVSVVKNNHQWITQVCAMRGKKKKKCIASQYFHHFHSVETLLRSWGRMSWTILLMCSFFTCLVAKYCDFMRIITPNKSVDHIQVLSCEGLD